MPSQPSGTSPDAAATALGRHLRNALTPEEMGCALGALLEAVPHDTLEQALSHLSPDTAETVRQVLGFHSAETAKPAHEVASIARLQANWTELWERWGDIVATACDEDGRYWIQENDWETPYLDETSIVDDLDQVAVEMLPLLPAVVEHHLEPDESFATAIDELETEIVESLLDGMELSEGFALTPDLSRCVLEFEGLLAERAGRDLISVLEALFRHEQRWKYSSLDSETVFDFFLIRPEEEVRELWRAMQDPARSPEWKAALAEGFGLWSSLHLELLDRFDPGGRIERLESAIPENWELALEVIPYWLEHADLPRAGAAANAALERLVWRREGEPRWRPEESILFEHRLVRDRPYGKLLEQCREVAEKQGQTSAVAALDVQLMALEKQSDWRAMLAALADPRLAPEVRLRLSASWKALLLSRYPTDPASDFHPIQYGRIRVEGWPDWLLDSALDASKGSDWFRPRLEHWLAELLKAAPATWRPQAHLLQLLTADLVALQHDSELGIGPKFAEVVLSAKVLQTADSPARREFLEQALPEGVAGQVTACWRKAFARLVPRPEQAKKSDYREHARWLAALLELDAEEGRRLLDSWRAEHPRRRSLWAAVRQAGIE